MKEKQLIALHGFLGQPSDWNLLKDYPSLYAVNLYQWQWDSLWDWATHFNTWVEQHFVFPRLLMGYSLGGRLALHALIQAPHLWTGALIISAHPGLTNQTDKEKRLEADEEWAERFEKEPWDQLMERWNGREVFAGDSVILKRKEEDYQRSYLAQILRKGSLGKQADLRKAIKQLSMPIRWMTGQNDSTYTALANSIEFGREQSKKIVIPHASHRLLWEQPSQVRQVLEELLT